MCDKHSKVNLKCSNPSCCVYYELNEKFSYDIGEFKIQELIDTNAVQV
jgi:hypothetical protein